MVSGRLAAVLALVLAAAAPAQQQNSIGIEAVEFLRTEDVVELHGQFLLDLDNTLIEAVDGGLELALVAEMRLVEERPFWVDRDRRHFVWTASLSKDRATGRYRYRAFGTEGERVVDTLPQALDKLSLLWAKFPAAEVASLLCSDRGLVLTRVEIDLKSLPDPLQISLLTSVDWDFSSGWKENRHTLTNC